MTRAKSHCYTHPVTKLLQSNSINQYRGRFAPSPTGVLHFGSLISALGSYLDAKANQGQWLVRIEDVDHPRCSQQAADAILFTLDAFGLYWDEGVWYQSQRDEVYQQVLVQLQTKGYAYPCCCTRKEIADSAPQGIDGYIYQGTCRAGLADGKQARAWRVLTHDELIHFHDRILGQLQQNLQNKIGDFVIKRADGLFAYQLAVVVDDAAQNINHIVRGIDLLGSTPRQCYLQRLLDYPTPSYLHLPLVVNEQGEKLSKQTLAPEIGTDKINQYLIAALSFLQQQPSVALASASRDEILAWALANWQPELLSGYQQGCINDFNV